LGIRRWWTDHRTVCRLRDGQWVPAPRRIERTWAWLMHRGKPVRPLPRIFWIAWLAFLIANDTLTPRFGWWLFLHPQIAGAIQIALLTSLAVLTAGCLFILAGMWLRWRKRSRSTRDGRDTSRLPPHE
jgi:hypothetical protein